MEFLKHKDVDFSARPPASTDELGRFACLKVYGLNQIFCLKVSTPTWRHLRRIFQVELTGTKQLEFCRHMREEEMAHMLRTIPQDGDLEVRLHLEFLFSNIMSRMVLNKRVMMSGGAANPVEQKEAREFKEIVEELSRCFTAFNPGDYIPAFKWLDFQGMGFQKQRKRMDAFVSNIISEHVERRKQGTVSEQEKDMVDLMFDEMGKKDGYEITSDHVKGIVWDAFAARTDTPSATTEWAMSELVRQPDIVKAAQAELDVVVGRDRHVQESDIQKLHYVQAIIKETFRLHPSAPLLAPHMCSTSAKALGYDIPANSCLFVNIHAIGRDESIWENPLEFIPERFLKGNPYASTDIQGQHYELLPYGAGRRSCPGMAMGLLLVQTSIANLIHAFDWSPSSGKQIDDIDMREGFVLTCPKAVPLFAHAKARLLSHMFN